MAVDPDARNVIEVNVTLFVVNVIAVVIAIVVVVTGNVVVDSLGSSVVLNTPVIVANDELVTIGLRGKLEGKLVDNVDLLLNKRSNVV